MVHQKNRTGEGIGQARLRVEDRRLLTGRGRYVDDVRIEGRLYGAFARSPEAHGRIRSLDLDRARDMDGVVAVFSGRDMAALKPASVNALMPEVHARPPAPLAVETVAAVGAPMALIVAENAAAAIDAAEAVRADIEPSDACPPNDLGHGEVLAKESWATGAADAASNPAAAANVRLRQPLLAPVALEPRSILADAASEPGSLTVWLGAQSPHRTRDELAGILCLEPSKVRVIAPDVGGAFGMKASLYPEEIAVAFAAWTLGRSIKWTASRSEEFLSATQGRGQQIEATATADSDGNLLSVEADIFAPLGAWMPYSAVVPPRNSGRILPGPYKAGAVAVSAAGVACNSAAVGIYRGAGRPEAAVTMELLIERLAAALDISPEDIRRRNFVAAAEMPFETATGQVLDSGDYRRTYDRAQELLATAPSRQAPPPGGEDRRGEDNPLPSEGRPPAANFGPSLLRGGATICYIEPSGQGWETAHLTLNEDGSIEAATGSADQGQGRTTAVRQIVAGELGVAPERISVVHGDSAALDKAIGALASRSTPIGGSALVEACGKLKAQAAALGGAGPIDPAADLPDWPAIAGKTGPLNADATFEAAGEAWGHGAVGCQVAIDPETGVLTVERLIWVDDAGVVVNPMLSEGQLHGGIAQGIGEALLERIVYDDDGQLLTGSFMDYGIPRADDMPPIMLQKTETPSPMNLLGAKGVGEAGAIGAPAAVACAVMAALRPLGVKHLDMPYTPARLWQAIQDAKAFAQSEKPPRWPSPTKKRKPRNTPARI